MVVHTYCGVHEQLVSLGYGTQEEHPQTKAAGLKNKTFTLADKNVVVAQCTCLKDSATHVSAQAPSKSSSTSRIRAHMSNTGGGGGHVGRVKLTRHVTCHRFEPRSFFTMLFLRQVLGLFFLAWQQSLFCEKKPLATNCTFHVIIPSMHRTSRSRPTYHFLCFASACCDVSSGPPCFEIFVMEGHSSTSSQFESSVLVHDVQIVPGSPFFEKRPDVSIGPHLSFSDPVNDVTKGPPLCTSTRPATTTTLNSLSRHETALARCGTRTPAVHPWRRRTEARTVGGSSHESHHCAHHRRE